MTLLELKVLEAETSDRFMQVHTDLTIDVIATYLFQEKGGISRFAHLQMLGMTVSEFAPPMTLATCCASCRLATFLPQ
jgi:hypothetical protein